MNGQSFVKCLTLTAAAGLYALFAAGCKVDQQKEVALYRQVLTGPASQPATLPARAASLTLREAMESANQHNERLMIQGETYVQALADKQRAFANFLPTVNLVPNYFRQDPAGGGSSAGSSGNDRFDVPVQGQMNVFNGFRDVANYRRSEAVISQRRWQLLDLQETVLLDVALAYYQILRSEQSVQVLATSLQTQEARVRETQARQQAGVARSLDVFQTESQAAQTRVTLTQARNDVLNGRSVLAFLTDYPVDDVPLSDRFDAPASVPSEDELMAVAAQWRQDLAAAIAATEAARQNVQVAFGQYFPSVNVNLQYFLHRESSPTDSQWNGLLSANLPIFSAGRIEADVRLAWSQLRQANNVESLIRRQIRQDVEIALQNLVSSRQRLQELQVQFTAADAAYRQSEASYRAGLATNLDRLQAQDALLSTQLQLVSEQYEQKVFYLNLMRVTGRLGTMLPLRPTTWPSTMPATAPTTLPAMASR